MFKRSQQGMIQLYIILAIVVVGGSAVAWYNHTIKQNARYEAALEEAEQANHSLVKQIDGLHIAVAEEKERAETASAKADAAVKRQHELEEIFSKHDLDYLLQKKPGLIINRANAATKRVLEDFREIVRKQPESAGLSESP